MSFCRFFWAGRIKDRGQHGLEVSSRGGGKYYPTGRINIKRLTLEGVHCIEQSPWTVMEHKIEILGCNGKILYLSDTTSSVFMLHSSSTTRRRPSPLCNIPDEGEEFPNRTRHHVWQLWFLETVSRRGRSPQ